MISPEKHPVWEVVQSWVDEDGDLAFTLRNDSAGLVMGYLSPDGEWSFWIDLYRSPDIVTQTLLKSLCARHIIDRAFGGKD